MKRKTPNTDPRLLAAESAAMTQFLFDVVTNNPGGLVPIQTVFDAYHSWRNKNGLPKTVLTIDGFGRLFPRAYPRKSAYCPDAKHALKCVFGLGIKQESGV